MGFFDEVVADLKKLASESDDIQICTTTKFVPPGSVLYARTQSGKFIRCTAATEINDNQVVVVNDYAFCRSAPAQTLSQMQEFLKVRPKQQPFVKKIGNIKMLIGRPPQGEDVPWWASNEDFYIVGDTPKPRFAFNFPYSNDEDVWWRIPHFDNTGPGKDDWIACLLWERRVYGEYKPYGSFAYGYIPSEVHAWFYKGGSTEPFATFEDVRLYSIGYDFGGHGWHSGVLQDQYIAAGGGGMAYWPSGLLTYLGFYAGYASQAGRGYLECDYTATDSVSPGANLAYTLDMFSISGTNTLIIEGDLIYVGTPPSGYSACNQTLLQQIMNVTHQGTLMTVGIDTGIEDFNSSGVFSLFLENPFVAPGVTPLESYSHTVTGSLPVKPGLSKPISETKTGSNFGHKQLDFEVWMPTLVGKGQKTAIAHSIIHSSTGSAPPSVRLWQYHFVAEDNSLTALTHPDWTDFAPAKDPSNEFWWRSRLTVGGRFGNLIGDKYYYVNIGSFWGAIAEKQMMGLKTFDMAQGGQIISDKPGSELFYPVTSDPDDYNWNYYGVSYHPPK
jgi:hypothetical protein